MRIVFNIYQCRDIGVLGISSLSPSNNYVDNEKIDSNIT